MTYFFLIAPRKGLIRRDKLLLVSMLSHIYHLYVHMSSAKHPNKWTIAKLRFNKSFHVALLCAAVINFLILMSALSFLSTFLHCNATYSSNFKFLSMRTPGSFCCLLSQIFALLTCTNSVSYLCADRARQIARQMPIERALNTAVNTSVIVIFYV